MKLHKVVMHVKWNSSKGLFVNVFIKVIEKILNKIKEFYLMRVCIKFGGNLMGI